MAFAPGQQTSKKMATLRFMVISFSNIRDNEFEPESWAWNMHYYQNDHWNVHKLFSIDGCRRRQHLHLQQYLYAE